MKITPFFYFLIFLRNSTLWSVPDLTIATPGLYRLGDFITSTLATTLDSIISIQASNVVLDLAGYVVKQPNATASITGITIASGLTNVVIKNGTIQNTTLNGITINSGCSNITLDGITIINCAAIGIAAASGGTNISIKNCLITNGSTTGPFGIQLTGGCSECSVSNTTIKNCGANTFFFSPFRLDCIDSTFNDVLVESCIGSGINAFEMFGNFDRNKLIRCTVRNCSTASLNGFILNNTGNVINNIFEECKCSNNVSSGPFVGISILNTIQNSFKDCIINGNSAASTLSAFFCSGNRNQFISCIIQSNASGNVTRGFDMETCNDGLIASSIIHANTGSTSSTGIFISSCNTWTVQDNLILRNTGPTDATSFGINTNTTTNLFTRNIAFRNGVTTPVTANQLSGLGGTQQQNNTSQLMNSNTLPWTNLGIAT